MTNKELQKRLKRYPDDYEVVVNAMGIYEKIEPKPMTRFAGFINGKVKHVIWL